VLHQLLRFFVGGGGVVPVLLASFPEDAGCVLASLVQVLSSPYVVAPCGGVHGTTVKFYEYTVPARALAR
jgi:hypothetical protein